MDNPSYCDHGYSSGSHCKECKIEKLKEAFDKMSDEAVFHLERRGLNEDTSGVYRSKIADIIRSIN